METLRADFLKIYAGIPSAIRESIVVVLDEKTYNWNAVYTEVVAETSLGDRMLTNLKELGII